MPVAQDEIALQKINLRDAKEGLACVLYGLFGYCPTLCLAAVLA